MNAGLSSIEVLKKYLLAPAFLTGNDFDDNIKAIGLGVATAFENYCNRKFSRAVSTTEIFGADRCQFLLSRVPVESVSKTELKLNETDGFIEQTPSPIVTVDLGAGIIYLPDGADLGPYNAQARFTYTGGFWWDDTDDGSGQQPAGSNVIPSDLQLAWLLQCAHLWKLKDKLGHGIISEQDKPEQVSTAGLQVKFIPQVESILGRYVRYNLS